jgi:hypothetical protein
MENVSTCPRCGGGNVTASVRVHQTAESGNIGLSYKTKLQVTGTEPLYVDVCKDCGTIPVFCKESRQAMV